MIDDDKQNELMREKSNDIKMNYDYSGRVTMIASPYRHSAVIYMAGLFTVLVGITVLAGWQFDIGILRTFFPGGLTMKANTAAAFLLSGVALILLQSTRVFATWLTRILAVLIMVVGVFSICHSLFGWNIGFEELLYNEQAGTTGTSYPGLMALNTAINFLLLGFAFFILTLRKIVGRYIIEIPLVFSLAASVIGFLSYFTGLVGSDGPTYNAMALQTAGTFMVLCGGMLVTAYNRQAGPITFERGPKRRTGVASSRMVGPKATHTP